MFQNMKVSIYTQFNKENSLLDFAYFETYGKASF